MGKIIGLFENNEFRNQKIKVFETLKTEPLTMLEISNLTNIRRANICRYVNEMEKKGIVAQVGVRKCTISGYPFVGEYSSDPDLFPVDNQLKLFSL